MTLWPAEIPDDIIAAMRARTEDDFRKLYMQEFAIPDRGTGRTYKQLLRLQKPGLFVVWDEREQEYVKRELMHRIASQDPEFDYNGVTVYTVYEFMDREKFRGTRFEDFDVDHQVWERLSNGSFSKESRFRDTVHRYLAWAKIEDASMFRGAPT